MNAVKIRVFCLILILCFVVGTPAQEGPGWRGIIPLRSTREQVRSSLGKPRDVNSRREIFIRDREKVSVMYSTGPCKNVIDEWRVSAGTVISVLVIPLKEISFSELKLGNDFERSSVRDDLSVEYTDQKRGIRYTVSITGKVVTIYYTPRTADLHLRCEAARNN